MPEIERETWLEDTARELRQPVRLSPTFDRRVMGTIRAVGAHGSEPRRCRPISWTPLRAMAAAAGIAGLAAGAGWLLSRERPSNPAVTARHGGSARPIEFVFRAPYAAEVALVGDFNDWDSTATPMRPAAAGGVWSVRLSLPAGRYQYAFVIDGREWRTDPAASAAPVDDFGAPNSIIAVTDQTS